MILIFATCDDDVDHRGSKVTIDTVSYSDLICATAHDVRGAIRAGAYTGHTAGLAAGKLQCNLAILPEEYALNFLRFCLRNPKP